jgi:cell division protein FtsB
VETVKSFGASLKAWLLNKRLRRFVLNKYVLTIVFFTIWMLFFDKQDYSYYKNLKKEHDELVRDTLYYHQEIENAQAQIKKLKGDKKELERFARETYFMKKDDEVVFVFLPDSGSSR